METVSRSQRYLALALAFRPPETEAAHDLTLAYTRLFLGPGRPIAPPYESVYIEGQLAGESAAQVAACYAEAGLQVSSGQPHVLPLLPDHISLELAFMAHLAMQEERNPDRAEVWRERQRRFLRGHLTRWLPHFCRKVVESEVHPFYCEAAQEARRLVEEEVARFAVSDRGLRIADTCTALARERKRRCCGLRNALSEIRNPKSGTERRYPNICLGVDLSRCTLCGLCADNCRPGALSIDCTPMTLSLAFDPAHCNGCRACLRLCPEDAITIECGPALAAPPSTPKSVVATATRVICPDCHRPHIAALWLERLAERLGGGAAVRRSLARCPVCKAASQGGPPIPVGLTRESLAGV